MARPRHPAAALLWTDWVLTEGQKIIAESLRIPAAKSVPGYKDRSRRAPPPTASRRPPRPHQEMEHRLRRAAARRPHGGLTALPLHALLQESTA